MYSLNEIMLRLRANLPAGALTLVLGLIILTPLCGALFGCGCDWPWAGLADHCNHFQHTSGPTCPWCASKVAGVASTIIALGGGVLVAIAPRYQVVDAGRAMTLTAIRRQCAQAMLGLAAFIVVGALAGWVAASVTHYPKFLFY